MSVRTDRWYCDIVVACVCMFVCVCLCVRICMCGSVSIKTKMSAPESFLHLLEQRGLFQFPV